MGYLTDRIEERKPIILIGCIGMIIMLLQLIYFSDLMNPKITLFVFGVFSGVAMIPYSIIKEANPDYVKGSATGVQNFLTFGVTSFISPIFAKMYGNKITIVTDKLGHFHDAIWFWIIGIFIAIILTVLVKETGHKTKSSAN
ncbi:MFS transporter [Empedobacter tilapiae]|uniref:MFS transporter n=1 Tax=Empedobacter tilapiae TaxID=2491114 RepID=UPI001FEC0149|nr:MFS transporter [Empedobacter tilapiae]